MEDKKSYFAVIPANVRYDERLRPNEKLLYGEITALCNEKGYCWASNHYFAHLYGVTPQAVSKWVLNLQKTGYISISYEYKPNTKEINTRIIQLVSINVDEVSTKVSGVSTNVDRGYQQKFKENNTGFNNNKNNIYISEFSELWNLYPRKIGKESALKAYVKARKSGTLFEAVKKGIEQYAEYSKNQDVKFIKHGSTWFNQKGWEDIYPTAEDKAPETSYDLDLFEQMLNGKD